jgi:hypothetical protein
LSDKLHKLKWMRLPAQVVASALALSAASCGGALPAPIERPVAKIAVSRDYDAEAIRRVCVQNGLGAPGVGGGSLVFLTGAEGGGLGIDTLYGDHVVAPGA